MPDARAPGTFQSHRSLTRIRHETTYTFDRPVLLGPHELHLRPLAREERVVDYFLSVFPQPQSLHWLEDPRGNWMARVAFAGPTAELRLRVDLLVEMEPIDPFDFLVDPMAETWPFAYTDGQRQELAGFIEPEAHGRGMAELVAGQRAAAPMPTTEFLAALNRSVHDRVTYAARDEDGVQRPEETLRLGTGSCRDSAWLLVQALRQLGLGARFVSGYLLPLDAPALGATVEGGSDGAGLHAWASVYVPGAGWLGLDPSNGTFCGEAYLPLASVVHYGNAAPVTGTSEPAVSELSFRFQTGPARGSRR